jgi:diacylglycerol kinase family enzyme
MRSLLIHNPAAGYGQVDAAQLIDMLTKAGHDVTYQSSDVDDLAPALDQHWDLVVVAGGDGTVTRVAKLCVGRPSPLAILPLGSANNLAKDFGHFGAIEDLINAWDLDAVRSVDVGVVSGDWGQSRFAESFGVGLIAAMIQTADKGGAEKSRAKFKNAAERLAAGMETLRGRVKKLDAIDLTIETPEGTRSGSFLWAEVLMAGSVGPGLTLFESHDTSDGMLSYALLPAEEREAFYASLGDRMDGHAPSRTGLVTGRTTKLGLSWQGAPVHLDGKLLPDPPSGKATPRHAEVTVQPQAIRVLRLRRSGAS